MAKGTGMNKVKIAIVENSITVTGAYHSIVHFTDEIKDVEFIYVVPKGSTIMGSLQEKGYKTYQLPFLELQKSWKVLLYWPILFLNAYRLKKILKHHQVSYVHVNDFYNLVGIALRFLGSKHKIVYHVRLLPTSYIGRLYSFFRFFVKRWSDQIIVVSTAVEKSWAFNKVTVIHDFYSAPEKVNKGLDTSMKLLYLSNFIPGKGQDKMVEVFAQVLKEVPEAKLHFVGNAGKYGARFKQKVLDKIIKLGLEKNVEFTDHVDDLSIIMQEHSLLVHLSESESFSMVCLEALYHGLPVVVADSGGPRDIVQHGESGYIVPQNNIEETVKCIVTLLANDEKRMRMSQLGKKSVQEKFSKENTVLKLQKLYHSLN